MRFWKKTVAAISGASDIPLDFAAGLPEIRLSGMRSLAVEPHRGVRSFAEDCVLVQTGGGLLCIRGTALTLKSISYRELRMTGKIVSLEVVNDDAC